MAKTLEIIHLADEDRIQLSIFDGQDRRSAPAVDFTTPLDDSDRREIAWYFRDYLDNPFGQARDRATAVETGLRNLGRLLFETVFRSNEAAAECYAAARSDGLSSYRLVISSPKAEFLALPWELLNEPDTGYLAPELGSVVRRTTAGEITAYTGQLATDQFNVLLVSPLPRPDVVDSSQAHSGDTTGSYGSLANAALSVLESLDVEVELDCLRPPTFAALAEHLAQRPGHYHLVHLDGLAWDSPDVMVSGAMVFEQEDGSAEPVEASRIAELLVAAGVPTVLINAGDIGPEGSVTDQAAAASRIAEAGVPLVVSVPFPLRGRARDLFTRGLLQPMAQGEDVTTAVAQARKALMDDPERSSIAGKVVYWDWITPIVYQSREYLPQAIESQKPDPLAPPSSQPQTHQTEQLPQGGPYGLVGRRAEIRHLERLMQEQPVVLMAGNAGSGKSELALGLAGWFQKTGGRTGGVFYTTFEGGAGLERVVHEIGTSVAGLPFADMDGPQQRRWVVEYLNEHPSLLVWDGIQNIGGSPGVEDSGLLEVPERQELDDFLGEIAGGGQSWALLVGRNEEVSWLSTPHLSYRLPELNLHDRMELASSILEASGLFDGGSNDGASHHLDADCMELLDQLNGHPLAMQIALPLLKELPASVISGELTGRLEQETASSGEEGRDPILTVLMEYSFSRMSRRQRNHLPFLSLFQRRIMMDILTHITQERVYRTVMGEELGWGACRSLLRTARDSGFLQAITPSVYQIHPSFPWFYGRRLSQQVAGPGIRQLEQEFVRVYADTADYFMESLYENQDSGATAVLAEEGNLTQALGLAMEDGQWDTAQVLVQPLAQVYRMQKRYPELRRLRRQLLQIVAPEGRGGPEAASKGASDLWLYLLGTEASEATEQLQLERSEELNRQLLDYLSSLPDGDSDPRTAAVYHQLGLIEQHRWHLDEAEGWFQRSLAIIEQGEDRASVADDYFGIGQIYQSQRRYTEAKEWFSKALDIHQREQDLEEMVKDYRALGLAAQYKFEYEEAESWYHRAREILEENRDEENAVLVFHELGTVYHARYLFEEAETWYQQALSLSDRLGMENQVAVEFHHLGLLSQARGVFIDDAVEWFDLARERWEKLGDRRSAGDECRALGVLFHEQQRLDEAEDYYRQAQAAFEEVQDVQRTARTYGQLGKVAEDRGDLPGALEWATRTHSLAVDHGLALLPQVKAHLAELRDKYGEENFNQWWRGYTGGDPPTDLDVETEDPA